MLWIDFYIRYTNIPHSINQIQLIIEEVHGCNKVLTHFLKMYFVPSLIWDKVLLIMISNSVMIWGSTNTIG